MDAGKAIMDTIASGVNLAEPLRNVLAKAMVLPSGEGIGAQLSGLTDKLNSSLATSLPLGPLPIAAAGAPGGTNQEVSVNFEEGSVQIIAEGGDPDDVMGAVEQGLGEAVRSVVEQMDSQRIA